MGFSLFWYRLYANIGVIVEKRREAVLINQFDPLYAIICPPYSGEK